MVREYPPNPISISPMYIRGKFTKLPPRVRTKIEQKLHIEPIVVRKRVETMMTFLPSRSAMIDSMTNPTTLPMNYEEMMESLTYFWSQ